MKLQRRINATNSELARGTRNPFIAFVHRCLALLDHALSGICLQIGVHWREQYHVAL